MINYMKSETYRLLRKKGVYITSFICYLLIAAAAVILYSTGKIDSDFPYATSKFFYSNVIASGTLIIIIGTIYNSALTGKDNSLIKQSISFGISRKIIFWSKLVLTLGSFLLICVIGMLLMIVLGESLFVDEHHAVGNFLIASLNMVPIVVSGFFLTHVLKMLKVGEAYIIIILLFVYAFSENLLRLLLRPFSGLNELYKYTPDALLDENLMRYLNDAAQINLTYWFVGFLISGIALLIGANRFAKQNID